MWNHEQLTSLGLRTLIVNDWVKLAGNVRLKIYGQLTCSSGKRMKKGNRVFFKNEREAVELGFRPCGHCLPHHYQIWKKLFGS